MTANPIAPHPTFLTDCPPDPGTFTGWLMLEVALGHAQLDDLAEAIRFLLDPFEDGRFDERFPFCERPSLEEAFATLDEVVRLHDELCPEVTPEAEALLPAQRLLADNGVFLHVSLADRSMAPRITAYLAGQLQLVRRTGFHTIAWCGQEEVMHMLRTGVLEISVLHTSGDVACAQEAARTMVDLLDSCGITKGELRPDWTARPLDPYEAILHGEVCPCALHQGLAVRVRIPGVRWRAPMHSLARFFGQPPQDGPLTDRPLTDGPLTNQPPMDLPPAEWESPGSDWAA